MFTIEFLNKKKNIKKIFKKFIFILANIKNFYKIYKKLEVYMSLLKEDDRNYLIEEFGKMVKDVEIVHFTSEKCDYCEDTIKILEEVAGLTDKIHLKIYDVKKDEETAKNYNIENMFPATILVNDNSTSIRFYGMPSGYEFGSLIEMILEIGKGTPTLKQETIERLKKIDKPVNIKIFVTTTCPYCPSAVVTAQKFSMANRMIESYMIEASEFPELSSKYDVYSVPKVVINEKVQFEGAAPEEQFLNYIFEAL